MWSDESTDLREKKEQRVVQVSLLQESDQGFKHKDIRQSKVELCMCVVIRDLVF